MRKRVIGILCVIVFLLIAPTTISASQGEESENSLSIHDNEYTDILDFQITLNGTTLEFPCTYDTLYEAGWRLKKNDANEVRINGNTFSREEAIPRDLALNEEISVYFLNIGKSSALLKDCLVAGVRVPVMGYTSAKLPLIELPRNILLQKSTVKDIIDAYGPPTEISYDGKYIYSITIPLSASQHAELTLEDNVLVGIDIRNFITLTPQTKASTDVPPTVRGYSTPTMMGEDLFTSTYSFGGDLYRFPTPFMAFEKNGWQFRRTPLEDMEANSYLLWGLPIVRDGTTHFVKLKNTANYETVIENCWIYSISSSIDGQEPYILLPQGITIGSTRDDLTAAYVDNFDRMDQSENEYDKYIFRKDRTTITVFVGKASDVVEQITMENLH